MEKKLDSITESLDNILDSLHRIEKMNKIYSDQNDGDVRNLIN